MGLNKLNFSQNGRLLSSPTETKEEMIEDCSIVAKFYNTNQGWFYSLDLKFKSCVHTKPVKQTDVPDESLFEAVINAQRKATSWLKAPSYKKIFSKFTLFDFQQREFDF